MTEAEIIKFFKQPIGLRKPTMEERSRGTGHGIYAWYSDLSLASKSKPTIPPQGPWRMGDFLLLYIGIVTKRAMKRRLYYAAGGGRPDQHQIQMGLGCLLSEALGIELCRGKQLRFLHFIPRDPLRIWINEHVYFKWIETNEAEKLEPILITKLRPLLNIMHNEGHPFHPKIKNKINLLKSSARYLPIIK